MDMNKIDCEEIAILMGYSYLEAGKGKWQDGGNAIHDIRSMDNRYVANCKKFIEKGIVELESRGIEEDILKALKAKNKRYKPSENDIKQIRIKIIAILKEKLEEFDIYRSSC